MAADTEGMDIKWITVYALSLVVGILAGGLGMNYRLSGPEMVERTPRDKAVTQYTQVEDAPAPMPKVQGSSGLWQLKHKATIPA